MQSHKTSIVQPPNQPNLFIQDKDVLINRDFSFYNNYVQTPAKTTFSLFS